MAKQTKLDRNTPAIDAFKKDRLCYNSDNINWTTYCKVTCEYGGTVTGKTHEIWIRSSGGKYVNLEVRGLEMVEDEFDTVLAAGRATFEYEDDTLVIHGTRDKKYYKISVGPYDADYVLKDID